MARIPTAADAETRFKMTLASDSSLLEAVDRIIEKGALGAPVIDASDRVVGVLTEKDCLRLAATHTRRSLEQERVGDHMSTLKGVVKREMDLFSVVEVFLAGNFPVLPILENAKLCGRISRFDLLKQIQELDRELQREKGRQAQDIDTRERPTSIEKMQRLAASHSPEQLAAVMRNRPRYAPKH